MPNFTVQPETRALNITKDHEAELRFLVSSHTTLRGEAHVIPVAVNGNRTPEMTRHFADWLTVVGERELDFDVSGEAKPYTVRIRVPDDADPGEYSFRLKVVDMAEPDETVGESPEIIFQVIGPRPTLAGFVLAAVIGLLILTGLSVWAVVAVNNRSNLQFSVTMTSPELASVTDPPLVDAGDLVRYELNVENKRLTPVERVRLRYDLPDGIMGASATVLGARTQQCDELNRGQAILCDLGTLAQDQRKTIQFTLIPDPNGSESAEETLTVLQGDRGLWGWIRSFFVSTTTEIQRDLQGNVENSFRLSGDGIATRREVEQVTVRRCLGRETSLDDEILAQESCQQEKVHISIDPAMSEATLDGIQRHTIRIWNESSDRAFTDAVVRYQLPERMRYLWHGDERALHPPLVSDEYSCALEGYFTIACQLNESLPPTRQVGNQSIPVQEIVLQLAATNAGTIQNNVAVSGILTSTASITDTRPYTSEPAVATTVNLDMAMRFDGVDDWVELGYAPGPLTDFTVELWLHPFSDANGQSFVGAHTADGQNLLLVGYWPTDTDVQGGLLVNILEEDYIFTDNKRKHPHHLAVTVRGDPQRGQYDVAVFIHDPETEETEQFGPQRFNVELPDEDVSYSNWVLGQEWDQGTPAPRTSDFFKGTMREVRIWDKALDAAQIDCVRTNRLYVNPDGTLDLRCLEPSEDAEESETPQIMGYWRLDMPSDAEGTTVADLVPREENVTTTLHGARLYGGIGWGGIDPRFGSGLLFDGLDNYGVSINLSETVQITQRVLRAPINRVVEAQARTVAQPSAALTTAAEAVTEAVERAAIATEAVATEATTTDEITATETITTNDVSTGTASTGVAMSIAAWLYVADGIPTERQWIAGIVGDEASMALLLSETGQVVVVANCGREETAPAILTSDTRTVPINTWVYYAGAMNLDCSDLTRSDITLYRDGSANQGQIVLIPAEQVPWFGCPANVYIGGLVMAENAMATMPAPHCRSAWAFKGQLDEVRIWPRRLLRDEIIRWRNRPGEFFDELAYWPFDEGFGNQTDNRMGSQHALQLVGPKWIDTNFDLADQGSGP